MAPLKTINNDADAGHRGDYTGPGDQPPGGTLRLTLALQVTLELNPLLAIFSREVAEVVPHDAVAFTAPDGEPFATASATRHRASYRLTADGEDLGEIVFSRQRRFAEPELMELEYLMCALLFPLRNALAYRRARLAAFRDPLTGLGNRQAMDAALGREVELARRNGSELALLAIDLDRFKGVNDTYGHSAGDAVLRATAERMRGATRASDLLFRYGGEEFVAVLANTGEAGARCVGERILAAIGSRPVVLPEGAVDISASIGIALSASDDQGPEALFDRADHALYTAKHGGRARVEMYRP